MSTVEKMLTDLDALEENFAKVERAYREALAQVRRYEERIALLEGELAQTQLDLERVSGEKVRVLHRPMGENGA